jgi:hypothetical protein
MRAKSKRREKGGQCSRTEAATWMMRSKMENEGQKQKIEAKIKYRGKEKKKTTWQNEAKDEKIRGQGRGTKAKYGGRSPKFIWAPCHEMCTAVLIG